MKTTKKKSKTMENEQLTEENNQPEINLESGTVVTQRKTPVCPRRFQI